MSIWTHEMHICFVFQAQLYINYICNFFGLDRKRREFMEDKVGKNELKINLKNQKVQFAGL